MFSPLPASSIQDGGAAAAPRVGDVRGMAEEAFDSGLHCAEAVASALARLQGIDAEFVTRMAGAFGSGMSLTRYTVRAAEIAAALLALSGADLAGQTDTLSEACPCKPMT